MSRIDFEVNEILRLSRGTDMDENYVRYMIRLKLESLLKNGFGEGFCYCADHFGEEKTRGYGEALNHFIDNY